MRFLMKNLRKILMIVAIAMFAFACSKNDGNSPNNPSGGGSGENDTLNNITFEFLKVGHLWVSEVSQYDSKGELTASYYGTTQIDTVEPYGDGIGYFSRITSAVINLEWFENADYLSMHVDTEPFLYKNNIYKGRKWNYQTTNSNAIYYYEILSINEDIIVPAGTFSCIKIKMTHSYDAEGETIYYVNSKYGLICIEDKSGGAMTIGRLFSKNF